MKPSSLALLSTRLRLKYNYIFGNDYITGYGALQHLRMDEEHVNYALEILFNGFSFLLCIYICIYIYGYVFGSSVLAQVHRPPVAIFYARLHLQVK